MASFIEVDFCFKRLKRLFPNYASKLMLNWLYNLQGFYYDAFYGDLGLNEDHFKQIEAAAKKAVDVWTLFTLKYFHWILVKLNSDTVICWKLYCFNLDFFSCLRTSVK